MEKILVLDFGGQYSQLIARRVRQEHIYAEIHSFRRITPEQIQSEGYRGIIFSDGPNSVYNADSPHFDSRVLTLGIPVLGICYGDQLMAFMEGGIITSAESGSEYGKTTVFLDDNPLFEGIPKETICWMSHNDSILTPPDGFVPIAHTAHCACAAMCHVSRKLYGVQFHPEVTHTEYGQKMLRNFLLHICRCSQDWQMDHFISDSIRQYKEELRGKEVLLALSGGVDSAVTAVLLHRAIGEHLHCVFVDHGLLRKNESEFVEATFRTQFGMHLIRADARERFLHRLDGISDPETKRKIIGEEFIRVFEEEAEKLGAIQVLAQGTIYPDVIESGTGDSATIKSHHNVGGIPGMMKFERIVEPLRNLFKDEVRDVGERLGLPHALVWRQPFPGPGLAVRIIGSVTEKKLEMLRDADAIFREEMAKQKLEHCASQFFAVLTDLRSVGVQGDARSYGFTLALRAVTTDDFMTAEWARLPFDFLETVSNRITNEIPGVNRVVYDITSKPPATVEWE